MPGRLAPTLGDAIRRSPRVIGKGLAKGFVTCVPAGARCGAPEPAPAITSWTVTALAGLEDDDGDHAPAGPRLVGRVARVVVADHRPQALAFLAGGDACAH